MDYRYRPSTILEKKAMFLEETMEKMQNHRNNLQSKINFLKSAGKPWKHLLKQQNSLNRGIREVSDKADNIWNQIKENP